MLLQLLLWVMLVLLKEIECSTEEKTYQVKQVTEPILHGEGPFWDSQEGVLYFVDTTGSGVHRYDPKDECHTSVILASTVNTLATIRNNPGKFVIGYGRNITILEWDGKSKDFKLYSKYEVDQDKPDNRLNDGKPDRDGNLWIGSIGRQTPGSLESQPNQGSLFKVSAGSCSLETMLTPVSASNGIAWNKANNVMYYIDTPNLKIYAFDYDEKTASIGNRRTLFDFKANNVKGVPDGMAIDENDNLYVATLYGRSVIQVSPIGELVQNIDIPAGLVTSVVWGGPKLDILYVTTMRSGLRDGDLEALPLSGAVFAITDLGVTGTESYPAAECLLSVPTISK